MKIVRLLRLGSGNLARLMGRLKAPQWVSLSLIAITLSCAGVLLWLIYQTALDKDTVLWGKAFLLILGLLAAIATVVVSWEPDETPALKRLTSPFGAGIVLLAVFSAFGAMTDALSLFEPRAATTDDTDRISREVGAVGDSVDELAAILQRRFPADPPILTGIVGRWGEQDTCALVWDIRIMQRGTDAALVADMVERPAGVEPFRLLAQIVQADGNTLTVIGEEPASARGLSAVFTLNAATGRLAWDDKANAGGLEEYVRCAEQ